MPHPPATRRERLRQLTLDDIHQRALEQVGAGGTEAVSLSAIARGMGMAQASIYRYYGSREELLGQLRQIGYAQITAAVEAAERDAASAPASDRLKLLLRAYRKWALDNPLFYDLMFGARPGTSDSAEAIAIIHGAMRAVLRTLHALDPAAGQEPTTVAEQELTELANRRQEPAGQSPRVLRLGSAAWTRAHGIVSLELAGVFADMGVDAGHLLDSEADDLATALTPRSDRSR